MDTQTMMGLAAGLGWGAAVVQTLRHSAAASRAIRAQRERDEALAHVQRGAEQLGIAQRAYDSERQAAGVRVATIERELACRTGERDRARAELAVLADLIAARDETIGGLQSALNDRGEDIKRLTVELAGLRRELGATLEQRDAATVARDAALAELAQRTADRDGADMAHEDCERRLAEMGERLAAAEQARDDTNRFADTLRQGVVAAESEMLRLSAEVESLKASLQAAGTAQDAPQAAAAPEVQAAPAVVRKSRRRG